MKVEKEFVIDKKQKRIIMAVETFENFIITFGIVGFNVLYFIFSGTPVSSEIKNNLFKANQ